MSRKKWCNKEFKMAAVKLALTTEKPINEVAEELGISKTSIRNWITLYGTGQGVEREAFTPEEHAELMKLRRNLKRVTEERDVLKKALGILSRELP
jgi:transposase-like protein